MGNGLITAGPYGGTGGRSWSFKLEGGKLNSIEVTFGECLYSMEFLYIDKDHRPQRSERFGSVGPRRGIINLGENEDILSVSGTVGRFANIDRVVSSLFIRTNVRTYGPMGDGYGTDSGAQFFIPVNRGKFEGFFGNCGTVIDSIGVYHYR